MARHYSFVLFLSASFSYLYFLRGGLDRGFTRWLALAFVNTHFFALIPIGIAFVIHFFRAKELSARISIASEIFLGLLVTVALNYRSLHIIIFFPPAAAENLSVFSAVVAAGQDYYRFWQTDTGIGFAAALVFFFCSFFQHIDEKKFPGF
jgi:hypothetical protein